MKRDRSSRTFWALSDPRRVEILDRIAAGSEATVSQLGSVFGMTRQAVTRHVKTLEEAGLLVGERDGRERRYRVAVEPIGEAEQWLHRRAASWDRALGRLAEYLQGQ